MNFYTGKKTWDLKSKKLAAFKPSCPEFGYLPFTIPSVSEIDIVTRLKENNTRFHVDSVLSPITFYIIPKYYKYIHKRTFLA